MQKTRIGIIGCGNISGIYFKNCSRFSHILEIAACADLLPEKARAKAEEFNVPRACSVEELLADPEIRIVINLTIPKAHADVCIRALKADKSVYVEKPLAAFREDGRRILEFAKQKGLLVGSAPDTFMGGGLQTCRKLIDDGLIGQPVAASAFMMGHGPEGWHPDPEFFYKPGSGPMFDMGPYYLTALVSLLGPVSRVTGSARTSFPERVATCKEKYGDRIKVEVPTHIAGVLDFENGAVCSLITSFDVWGSRLPHIEIYGSEGTLSLPDPNTFGGPVFIRTKNSPDWNEVPLTHGFTENSRGIGVADMACALLTGKKHRAGGEMAYHVLDLMHGFHDASESGLHYTPESTCRRPDALPAGLTPENAFLV